MTSGERSDLVAQPLDRFISDTSERETVSGRFGNESARTLRIDVDGGVWLTPGAAIAYHGAIRFERQRVLTAPSLKSALLRETAPLVHACGKGRLYCARRGSHVFPIALAGETIVVAWPDLLAIEDTLACVPTLVDHGIGVAAGGLVAMQLSGYGAFAMASHGRPLTIAVSEGNPVSTDPHATMAWSSGVRLRLKTDVSWRSAFQHGGQEPVQILFEGTGFVVVQPYEDPSRFTVRLNPLQRLAAMLTG
jgi:uncharacterized protein (AIM24 family)